MPKQDLVLSESVNARTGKCVSEWVNEGKGGIGGKNAGRNGGMKQISEILIYMLSMRSSGTIV